MQLETYEKADGRRVRLTEIERDRLLRVVEGNPKKEIAFGLMARCGCRSQEVVDVRPLDLVTGDETDRKFLRIPEGKGNKERLTPIPLDLATIIRVRSDDPGEPAVGVSTRTIRRWVERAGQQLAAETGDERWRYLGPHDLRRTWGHLMLEAEVMPSVLMQWGGWDDYETFQRHYLGKHSEEIQAREAGKVNWL